MVDRGIRWGFMDWIILVQDMDELIVDLRVP
jgi:hypothetical protein